MKKISFSIISLSLIGTLFIGCTKKCDMPATVKVNAGPDQTISLPNSVTLTGTVTSGLTPNTTYLWSEISGPNTATLTNNTTTTSTASNLAAGSYLFQFQATNNAGSVGLDTVSITVNTIGSKTIIIQPGTATGQDAEVVYVPGLYDGNGAYGTDAVLRIMDWTYAAQGAGEGWTRSFIKFTALDTLPAGTVITSAKLSLYGMSAAESATYGFVGANDYPGSPYPLSNALWLQKATADWDQSTITYNNQPAITTTDEVAVPASTTQYSADVTNLDVTQLVKDMIATPGTNFGFRLILQTETYYRSQGYNSSESLADSSNGPKLIITYQ